MAQRIPDEGGAGTPLLEWLVAGLGVLVVAGLLGSLGWQAWLAPDGTPPELEVRLEEVVRQEGAWLVQIRVRNEGTETAAQAAVEGVLRAEGSTEKSSIVFDYVPGRSHRKGGLVFTRDPRAGELELRAMGWIDP